MPGMDGFQAVQSIKNNPRTAAIPILMYTSQEGDLYLGPGARARRRRRAAQADQAGRRHEDALPAAAGVAIAATREQTTFTRAGPRARTAAGQRIRDRTPLVVQPAVTLPPPPSAASAARGSAIREAAAEDVARDPRRARPVAAEGNRRAARLHRHDARFACRTPARRPRGAAAGDAHSGPRPADHDARATRLGRHRRLDVGAHRAWPAPRSCPGCGGTRAARSPRCAPISPPPMPRSKRCARGPR